MNTSTQIHLSEYTVCILNTEQVICNDDGECCPDKHIGRKVIEKRDSVRMVAKQGIFGMIVPETESGGDRKKALNQIHLHRIDYIFLAPSRLCSSPKLRN